MSILDRLLRAYDKRRLQRINEESYEKAIQCMCGKPAVVKVQDRYKTRYKPTWGRCEEHKGLPLDTPWISYGDAPMRPADSSAFTRSHLDGSPAIPEYPVIVEHIRNP